jgi:hypothetical protein|tara:strand:+ start:289 stop:504 length:216 start_codon:yes stop_codon:yes gene_type:complete
MSKLNLKHKDEIIIKVVQKQQHKYRSTTSDARGVNEGWVQALLWVLGFTDLTNNKIKEENNSEEKDTETKS